MRREAGSIPQVMPRQAEGLILAPKPRDSQTMPAMVYIMASKKGGTLYTGVTNYPARRIYEHREALVAGFTRKYGVKILVWYEMHQSIDLAIRREKNIKGWPRAWKLDLINAMNPDWADLYWHLG